MVDAPTPLLELADTMLTHDWDLHCERAGGLNRQVAGEGPAVYVAVVSRNDFALEAEGETPAQAMERLAARVAAWAARSPDPRRAPAERWSA